jgi:YVTN family beta-propeller protein
LAKSWNGLAFSRDGKQCFVSGGIPAKLRLHLHGEATFDRDVKPALDATNVFWRSRGAPAWENYSFATRRIEVWALNPNSSPETTISRPAPALLRVRASSRHLYVSDWGGRTVSVVDTDTGRQVRQIAVGLRQTTGLAPMAGCLYSLCR